MSDSDECWICRDKEVVYVDVLKMGWCEKHFREFYLEEGNG